MSPKDIKHRFTQLIQIPCLHHVHRTALHIALSKVNGGIRWRMLNYSLL